MIRLNKLLLKSRQKFPKPEMDLDFNIGSKIQEGATSVDVAGWTGTNLQEGLATVDVTQLTPSNQSVWAQGYDPDGSDLVVNGSFNTDISGWTDNSELSGSTSWDASGAMSLNNPAGSSSEEGMSYQLIPTVNGQNYVFTLSRSGGGSIIQIGTTIESNTYFQSGNNTDAISISFTALSANTYITLRNFNKMTPALIDSVTLHDAIENDSKSRIVFDGDDYQEDMPTQSGDFTFFIKFDTEESTDQVLMGSSTSDDQLFFVDAIGSLKFRTSLAIDREYAGADFTDGTTRVVALTRSGDDFELYVDGSPVLSVTDAGDMLLDWLGSRMSAGIGFEGNMYKALIYPEALTADEIILKSDSLS